MKLKMWKKSDGYEGPNYTGYYEGVECRKASLDFNHGSFAEISNFEVKLVWWFNLKLTETFEALNARLSSEIRRLY